jgi:hypothetical protein
MTNSQLPLERAFELARSGKFASTTDIKSQLSKEGFQIDQLSGGSLMRQLRTIMKAATGNAA